MNRERAKELLPVIQAFAEGKTIQRKSGTTGWLEDIDPDWVNYFEYRIKPEPREFWVNTIADHKNRGLILEVGKNTRITSKEGPGWIKVREVLDDN